MQLAAADVVTRDVVGRGEQYRAFLQRHGWLLASFVLAAYFALTVGSNGIPALRHDWFWPRDWAGRDDVFLATTSGWLTQGIGEPNPFVNNYLLVALLVPLEALFGAYGALLLFLFAAASGIVLAARKLAIAFGAHAPLAIVAGAFALFNPWTYSQIVAGHGAMLVAYAATMALVAEALATQPRPSVCAAAVAFTLPQLQFFLPALLVAALLALRDRHVLPLATWLVAGAANALGVIFAAHSLLSVPVTAAWEQTQSLAPLKAMLLSGYFARYADGYDHLGQYAVACIALLALGGALTSLRSKRAAAAVAATILALVVAMGVHGPLAGAFSTLIERLPAIGLYRELYDLIGYVAIGYVALSVVAAARWPVLALVFAGATAALLVLWAWHAPTRFWVDRRSLPTIPVIAAADTRIALLPPFQPLSYRGKFSGLDPDAYPRDRGVNALNQAVPKWPADAALATYVQDGDAGSLAALSVSEIANRPWYSMTLREFSEQIALPVEARPSRLDVAFVKRVPGVPLLSIIRIPPAASVSNRIGAGAVFFGDVAGLRAEIAPPEWATFARPTVVRAPRRYVHAGDGWVDARLAFAADPHIAQPFGGALTTSESATLELPGGPQLLVYVRGKLSAANGRQLTGTTGDYRWIKVPSGVTAVRCQGLCVVALQGNPPADIAPNAQPPASEAVDMRTVLPFFVQATLPAGPETALRYNVRFDEHWECLGCPAGSVHIPLDVTMNAWLLPQREQPVHIRLVERLALAQTLAQLLGLLWILVIVSAVARDALAPVPRLRRVT